MCLFPVTLYPGRYRKDCDGGAALVVPCGKCLECIQRTSVEWAARICHEAGQYKDNCFITLTYNSQNLPPDGSVLMRDVQLFIKRLRKALSPQRMRYFACGEYGSKGRRPHYHIICFGFCPDDLFFWQHDKKADLYRSYFIEKLWTKGFSSVGKVSYDSALYCAKYMNKYAWQHFTDMTLKPPFITMSNRPGIGYNSVYKSDLVADRIYVQGHSVPIPRYYLKVMERDGIFLDRFRFDRKRRGEILSNLSNLKVRRLKMHNKFLLKNLVFFIDN